MRGLMTLSGLLAATKSRAGGTALKLTSGISVVLLGAVLGGCAIMAATATDPESKRQWEQAEAEWEDFGRRLSDANAAYAAGLAQSPSVQVQPMPPVSQQTFCNQSGNMLTCNGPGLQQRFCTQSGNMLTCNGPGLQQTFCNQIGNTITCQ